MNDDKFTIFYCGRNRDVECADCECCGATVVKSELKVCTFELRGSKAGQTCGKKLCKSCGGMWRRVMCPPHKRLIDKERKIK